jgi:hypothetical protein
MKKALITVKQLDKEVQLAILAGKRKKINCGDSLFVDVLPSCLPPVSKAPCANCSGREPYFLSDSCSGTI